MKKSILALGAAAVVGGLGFAGSAQAIAFFGNPGADNHVTTALPNGLPAATALQQNAGGLGHFLFVPYYTAQGSMVTFLTITNTDMTNGKAVKVRFRGAANSDDLRDFTVMLSPGDVWSAQISKGADGVATLATDDHSCTLPQNVNAEFDTERLDQKLSAAALATHANEGYVEILNMADVPPMYWSAGTAAPGAAPWTYTNTSNALFATIKHKSSKPDCDQTLLNSTSGLLSEAVTGTMYDAANAGLGAPTGQLMASYALVNLGVNATFGGSATAIRAVDGNANNAYGNIVYSPQMAVAFDKAANISYYTADPLFGDGSLSPLFYDLPDMSTPLVPNALNFIDVGGPLAQVDTLGLTLSKSNIINEYAASASKGYATDWVVSQPTRRYYATIGYSDRKVHYNTNMILTGAAPSVSTDPTKVTNNPYSILTPVSPVASLGTYACMTVGWGAEDREENGTSSGTSLSPGTTTPVCGEVYTFTFGGGASTALQAQVTNYGLPGLPGDTGWAVVTLGGNTAANLPSVGFAAAAFSIGHGAAVGYTLPHRWN